ncbi:MAG TPA: serine hydroxymethyltransferase [Planctomycetota bacterium]|nr:serine hydroxymethyltransferase [Planctomycetota bacterium]
MAALDELREIVQLCRRADAWRSETINLIASENVLSPAARRLLDSDFHHRYAEGHPGKRYYEGTRFIDEIEEKTRVLVGSVFKADRVDVRLPSGTLANEAAFSALVPQGATALAHGLDGGGHISHARFGALGKRAARILELPRHPDGYRLDAAKARDMIRAERPQIVVLGRSLFLFPEPVREIKEACADVKAVLLYDASHVLGLVAGGEFQDPLGEGADLVTASTHKTYFGPQRGIIVSRGKDDEFWKPIDRNVFPGVTSNHHLFSLPSLHAATLEVREFGASYAQAIVRNARALGAALHKRGLHVDAADLGYTASHQVAVDVAAHGGGRDVAKRLSQSGIICNMNVLPGREGQTPLRPAGIRLGVQEMTRFGMGEAEMGRIAELIHASVVAHKNVADECRRLRAAHPEIRYGYRLDQIELVHA